MHFATMQRRIYHFSIRKHGISPVGNKIKTIAFLCIYENCPRNNSSKKPLFFFFSLLYFVFFYGHHWCLSREIQNSISDASITTVYLSDSTWHQLGKVRSKRRRTTLILRTLSTSTPYCQPSHWWSELRSTHTSTHPLPHSRAETALQQWRGFSVRSQSSLSSVLSPGKETSLISLHLWAGGVRSL